ncbi:MAG TPA: M56 family metallopeptidase [Longimicrobium sp.]|nr:M56 family metallopeptidase [Longimicrobium sp.]
MPALVVSAGWTGWVLAWLGTYVVHGTLLLGGAWLASRLVRSPGVRDALWKTAVAGALATTTLSVVAARRAAAAPELTRRLVVTDTPGQMPLRRRVVPPRPALPPWAPPAVLAVWLAGALAGLARLEQGRRRYWRAAGPRHAAGDAQAADALRRLRSAAGVNRTVYITAAEGLTAPAAVGLAEICLPAGTLAALTPLQREGVLAHELGHLVRRDPLWKVAVEIGSAVLWFQPLLRVAGRQMAECAELLADGFAVRITGRRRPLLESLGILAATFPRRGAAAAGFGDGGSPLLRRAARLMDATRAPAGPLPAAVRAGLAVAVLAATLAFSPGVSPPPAAARRAGLFRVELNRAELNAARTDVASVDPGGSLRVATIRNGVRRELLVVRGADGRPTYDYRENGAPRPFDAEARAWLARMLNGG